MSVRPDSDSEPKTGCDKWLENPKNQKVLGIVGACVAGGLALTIGLILTGMPTLDYYQYGFARSKTTGKVNSDLVYEGGRHFVGADSEFKIFSATAHFLEFSNILVFTLDKLEVSISCTIQYFLRPHHLSLLHASYDLQYGPVISNTAQGAIKNSATLFGAREYYTDRIRIEETLFAAVRDSLGGACCEKDCLSEAQCASSQCRHYEKCVDGCIPYEDCSESDYGLFVQVRYFQLLEMEIPSELRANLLTNLLLGDYDDVAKNEQEAAVVRAETTKMVQDIDNEALELVQSATSEASLIRSIAQANSTAILLNAQTVGLKNLYDQLNITDGQQRASFDYLRTLKGLDKVKVAISFNEYVSGPQAP